MLFHILPPRPSGRFSTNEQIKAKTIKSFPNGADISQLLRTLRPCNHVPEIGSGYFQESHQGMLFQERSHRCRAS
jgi:hypothetical protein